MVLASPRQLVPRTKAQNSTVRAALPIGRSVSVAEVKSTMTRDLAGSLLSGMLASSAMAIPAQLAGVRSAGPVSAAASGSPRSPPPAPPVPPLELLELELQPAVVRRPPSPRTAIVKWRQLAAPRRIFAVMPGTPLSDAEAKKWLKRGGLSHAAIDAVKTPGRATRSSHPVKPRGRGPPAALYDN